ncbi:hypothetical protein C9994_17715, partial [Marivirga lumbricoides]
LFFSGNLLKILFLLFFISETWKVLISYYSDDFIEYGFHFIIIWMIFVPIFFLFSIFEIWYLKSIIRNIIILLIPIFIPLSLIISFLIIDQLLFLWSISLILLFTIVSEVILMIYYKFRWRN